MPNRAAFMRGLNLGKSRRVNMVDLKKAFVDLGFDDVDSFITSGNIVFRADAGSDRALETRLESGLHTALGFETSTIVRTSKQLLAIGGADPFAGTTLLPGAQVHVVFTKRKPTASEVSKLRSMMTNGDELALVGNDVCWLRQGRLTDLGSYGPNFEGVLGKSITMRTLNTVNRLNAKFFS